VWLYRPAIVSARFFGYSVHKLFRKARNILLAAQKILFAIQNFFLCNVQIFSCVSLAGVKFSVNEGLRTFFMGPSSHLRQA
jgi:hypothetical protein